MDFDSIPEFGATKLTRRGGARSRHPFGPASLALVALGLAGLCGCPAPSYPPPKPLAHTSLIRERPGSARIYGVGPIVGFAEGRDCTFMHCLELVLEGAEPALRYDELMGLSGMAFRTQFRVDRWDTSNSDPPAGDDCLPALFTAIGWEYEQWMVRKDDPAESDAMRRAIRASVDRGVPVLALNIIPPDDWGIITGYERERDWLCRSYNGDARTEDRPATGWPTAVVILSRRITPLSRREGHLAAIRRAVSMYEEHRSGMYSVGRSAFDDWRQSLRSAREPSFVHPNFWTYVCLIDARGAAVRFLRSIAPEFGVKEAAIREAADAYDREARLLLDGLRHVPSVRSSHDVIPPEPMRQREIEVLKDAQDMEKRAIEALRRAL